MGFIVLPAMNPISSFIEDFAKSFEDFAIRTWGYRLIFAMYNNTLTHTPIYSLSAKSQIP